MTDPSLDAAAHLKTIRALMERATVYRAISGAGALAGGVLTLLVSGVLLRLENSQRLTAAGFVWLWLGVLVVVAAVNFLMLFLSARRRGDPFASSGMRMALRAAGPPMLAGFVLSVQASRSSSHYVDIVSCWILFYGLGLLAMGSFAPRSLVVLGGAFTIGGLLVFHPDIRALDGRQWQFSITAMAASFGGLHLLYALWVYSLQRSAPAPDGPGGGAPP